MKILHPNIGVKVKLKYSITLLCFIVHITTCQWYEYIILNHSQLHIYANYCQST